MPSETWSFTLFYCIVSEHIICLPLLSFYANTLTNFIFVSPIYVSHVVDNNHSKMISYFSVHCLKVVSQFNSSCIYLFHVGTLLSFHYYWNNFFCFFLLEEFLKQHKNNFCLHNNNNKHQNIVPKQLLKVIKCALNCIFIWICKKGSVILSICI